MHYIIDGYNLFHKFFSEEDEFQSQRETLISWIENLSNEYDFKATIVFDSSNKHNEIERSHKNNISIIYTSYGTSADDFIIELIKFHNFPYKPVIVSSDKTLCLNCRMQKHEHISVYAFIKKYSNQKTNDDKHYYSNYYEDKRLEKIFEEKLKKTED